jgi:hypothetical protein
MIYIKQQIIVHGGEEVKDDDVDGVAINEDGKNVYMYILYLDEHILLVYLYMNMYIYVYMYIYIHIYIYILYI